MRDAEDVVISRLGAKGDGVAMRDDMPLYVPFALPGERWHVPAAGDAERLSDSAERAAPVCRHFTACGGCAAQHMSPGLYNEWKRGLVVEAFRHRGIAADVAPLTVVDTGSRRRAVFGIERHGGDLRIGFREEGQHTLVDLAECPVLDPLIVRALPGLRTLVRRAMGGEVSGRLMVTRLDRGLDVSLACARKSNLEPQDRSEIAEQARRLGLVRLVVGGELIVATGRPTVTIARVEIEIAPELFLQAVPQAETLLADLTLAALPKRAKAVADLFSGVGTLTLPMARRASVTAFDSDRRAIEALQGAVRHTQGLKPVTAIVRDLFRDPLSVRELGVFDAVVLDPPRAGAAMQTERLAKSKVPLVVAVSCNPATLARDARVLIDGGYRMGAVTPIDQFLYSPHVEAVAVFRK